MSEANGLYLPSGGLLDSATRDATCADLESLLSQPIYTDGDKPRCLYKSKSYSRRRESICLSFAFEAAGSHLPFRGWRIADKEPGRDASAVSVLYSETYSANAIPAPMIQLAGKCSSADTSCSGTDVTLRPAEVLEQVTESARAHSDYSLRRYRHSRLEHVGFTDLAKQSSRCTRVFQYVLGVLEYARTMKHITLGCVRSTCQISHKSLGNRENQCFVIDFQ